MNEGYSQQEVKENMAYDLEKYRDKREKVLGVKKRGISFGAAYFNTRHLDDAIYKLQNAESWPQEIVVGIEELAGVKGIETDSHSSRVVITFDKSITDTKEFNSYFKTEGIEAILLNRVSRTQRLKTLKKEAKFEGVGQ